MRKLLGRSVTLTASVIAAACFTAGCNQQQTLAGEPAAAEPHVQASVEKGQVPDAVETLLSLCGYEVQCKSFADGEVNISGNRVVDAFFSAAANLEAQAGQLEASVQADLRGMAAILGVEVDADASIEDLTAAISGHIEGGFGGMIDGNISLEFQPAQCSVTAQATIEASAKCDVMAKGPEATVECKGECVAEANVMAECSGSAELECKGTAPSFECEGSCQGTCNLTAAATCEGECTGTCEVDAAADCDGEFTANEGGAQGSGTCKTRAGAKCNGMCSGSCELSAGGDCSGECKGECTYTAPEGGCTGGARASCSASGDATVECKGECKGEVTPPEVSAECEATAKAEADFSAECTPPQIGLSYELTTSAEGDFEANADARLAFEARIEAFAKAYGELLAKGAKIELVANAGLGLAEAGAEAVGGLVGQIATDANVDLQGRIDGFCAVGQLEVALTAVTTAGSTLTASAQGVAGITGAING